MLIPEYEMIKKLDGVLATPIIFSERFEHYSAEQLQTHFGSRQNVNYFPVCEADQVTVEFIDDVMQNRFTFNHETHSFGSTINWLKKPSDDIEWFIMLHKGYYLVGLGKLYGETGHEIYREKLIELIDSWIEQIQDPGFIATDVTGRRIQNWIYAFYYIVHRNPNPHKPVCEEFLQRFLIALENQVSFLINNLAVKRNHRTLELYAIFLAAVVFPELKKSQQWLEFSIQALTDNAATDILADGVHCELSTFYHHIVLKNLLVVKRLAVANNISIPNQFDLAILRALDFSLFVHKPDGFIPSLSDGDTGSFYDLLQQGYELYGKEQLRYVFSQGKKGDAPAQCVKAFAESGYYVLRSDWNNNELFQDARYLVFDCGPLGAGNHGHLDLLNIEVTAYGRSLVVDPGRYTYDESGSINWRVLFRSTRYHNTVEVDGLNQINYRYSERRGKYKIQGPHSQSVMKGFISSNACHLLHGKAHSYEYTALHERKIFFVSGEYWLISDILHDKKLHQYALRYHLSAEAQDQITIEKQNDLTLINSPNLLLIHPFSDQSSVTMEPGFVSTTYGNKKKAPIIKFYRETDNTVFETVLFPYKEKRPEINVQLLHCDSVEKQPTLWASSTFSLTFQTATQQVQDLFFISHDGTQRHWHYKNLDCVGQFCYIRLNDDGSVGNFFTGPGSHIEIEGQSLLTKEVSQ